MGVGYCNCSNNTKGLAEARPCKHVCETSFRIGRGTLRVKRPITKDFSTLEAVRKESDSNRSGC